VKFLEAICRARASGDIAAIVDHIPYARFMGITMDVAEGEVTGKLAFADHLVGNAVFGALHGGTIGALLESTAVFTLLWRAETETVPKTINITVEYLRSGQLRDTFARASVTRQGRRIATVRALAWQDDPDRPIAAANAHFLLVPAETETPATPTGSAPPP
jgi:uncharacterized protein (TIGR00369 family)